MWDAVPSDVHPRNEDSNLHAHLCSLIRVFVVGMKKLCFLGYPKCAQGSFWACMNVQADLNIGWTYMSKATLSDLKPQIILP